MNLKTSYQRYVLSLRQICENRFTHTTVDKKDVEFHSGLKKTWWDPNGPLKLLHSLNSLRVPYIRDHIIKCSHDQQQVTNWKDIKVLDVGCGGGILSEGLAELGVSVTGIDVSEELIALAKNHCLINNRLANNKPTYYCSSVEEHSHKFRNYYDAVVASEVIEHVADQKLFVESCVRATKPGAKLFFTTPNRTRSAQFYVIFMAENIYCCIPKGTHQLKKFIRPPELSSILKQHGCSEMSFQGYTFDYKSTQWRWTKLPLFFYALHATKK